MTATQLSAIEKQGQQLLTIFPNATEQDPVKLCKKLRRYENQGTAIATRLCNGPEFPGGYEQVEQLTTAILTKVDALLGNWKEDVSEDEPNRVPIFVNRDPRGYALKIRESWMLANNCQLHKDWGGYGILAPEIDKNGN